MRLLREPLIHFLVLGAALFLVFNIVGDSEDNSTESIVVSAGRIAQLTEAFTRTWQRPPTEQELEGLIEDHVREEVYYREALAMGLDRDDTIVRRRLRQKLEFFTDDLMANVDPTDEQLQAYLDEHPDDFRIPAQLSFRQIYFNRDRRGAQATQDAETLLARLNGAGSEIDTAELGDPLMLPAEYELISEVEVARRLGAEFAAALPTLPLGRWSGPVESGFGLHLVLISERHSGSLPSLAEIRKGVEREWRNVRRKEASDAFYNGLRDRYEVSVEGPEAGDGEGDSKLAEARR
jgi:hypothetical protein